MSEIHVMFLAGEASGDAHAAEVAAQLKLAQPDIRISGMGGQEMKNAGVEVFFDSSIIAVTGLIEVLRHWGDIKQAMNIVKRALDQTRPNLLVLVDYPEFACMTGHLQIEFGVVHPAEFTGAGGLPRIQSEDGPSCTRTRHQSPVLHQPAGVGMATETYTQDRRPDRSHGGYLQI